MSRLWMQLDFEYPVPGSKFAWIPVLVGIKLVGPTMIILSSVNCPEMEALGSSTSVATSLFLSSTLTKY